MPTATYIALANLTLTGTDASITFSSIPATYRDLVLVYDIGLGGNGNIQIRLNSDTGSNYSTVWAYTASGSSSGFSASETTTSAYLGVSNLAKFWGTINFMDYSATDKHTTFLSRYNETTANVVMSAHRWANTNAVTSIEVFTSASSYGSGSTFSLFGIAS